MERDSSLKSYTAPRVQVVGTLGALTQVVEKNFNPVNDGFQFQHHNINVS